MIPWEFVVSALKKPETSDQGFDFVGRIGSSGIEMKIKTKGAADYIAMIDSFARNSEVMAHSGEGMARITSDMVCTKAMTDSLTVALTSLPLAAIGFAV
jgi:hypothetical protein